VYSGAKFRRAHLDIIDARETKGLYMMHLCIFPHTNDPAPIFGFDVIAGAKKVTGAFHDFSPIEPDHVLMDLFTSRVTGLEWSKPRELPDWARAIFSEAGHGRCALVYGRTQRRAYRVDQRLFHLAAGLRRLG
jgi:hypothetical protein